MKYVQNCLAGSDVRCLGTLVHCIVPYFQQGEIKSHRIIGMNFRNPVGLRS